MKTIGILGGAGWRSTIPAYRYLNEEMERRTGRSARVKLYSMDYSALKALYPDWTKVAKALKAEVTTALAMKPDCFFIANNTLHKPLDMLGLSTAVPFFHAVQLTCRELLARQAQKVLFLGTPFTMQDDYFKGPLSREGIEVTVPEADDQQKIGIFQDCLLREGKASPAVSAFFQKLMARFEDRGYTDVVLACTELPLAIDRSVTAMTITNPLLLQCNAAIDFALG